MERGENGTKTDYLKIDENAGKGGGEAKGGGGGERIKRIILNRKNRFIFLKLK